MFVTNFVTNLLQIMDERHLSIEAVANAAGLTRESLSKIINYRQVPSLTSFEKICSALELNPNDLLLNKKSLSPERNTAVAVTKSFRKTVKNSFAYSPVCPICNAVLQTDWQSHCDLCGQKLSWKGYIKSKVVTEKPKLQYF